MTGSRDDGGIGPNFAVANCDILRVPVLGSIGRCSGGVGVKNGNAKRDVAVFLVRALGRCVAMETSSSINQSI
jgi:hypothetical protein